MEREYRENCAEMRMDPPTTVGGLWRGLQSWVMAFGAGGLGLFLDYDSTHCFGGDAFGCAGFGGEYCWFVSGA